MTAPTIQVLESGDRNHVIHVVGVADNTGAPGTVIVDLSSLPVNSNGEAVTALRFDRIWYETDGLIGLSWDADTQVTFFQLAPGQDEKCYKSVGGIQNNASTGKTGDVRANPAGAAKNYSVTLWFTKKYN